MINGAKGLAEVIENLSLEGAHPAIVQLKDVAIHVEHFVLEMQLSLLALECCPKGTKLERLAAARVIHSIYEMKRAQDDWFNKKILTLGDALGVPIDSSDLRRARKTLAQDLKIIDSWSLVRNTTTGHYSGNAKLVETGLDGIDVVVVHTVAAAQLAFLYEVMQCVRLKWKERTSGGSVS